MPDTPVKRTKVFVSYSHQDQEWLSRLRVHLRPLERRYGVDVWVDTDIKPGAKWREEIEKALAAAKVAVLLISADFVASDFVEKNELPPLLRSAEAEGTVILPLILSPSMFSRLDNLAQFQAVNDPAKPLVGLTRVEQEAALVRLTEAVEIALGYSPSRDDAEYDETRWASKSPILPTEATAEERRLLEGARKRARLKSSPAIWGAVMIIGLVAIVAAYWQFIYTPSHAEVANYTGRVIDSHTNKPIRNAKVTIEEDQSVPQIQRTDSEGIFSVNLRGTTSVVRIRVDMDGYDSFDRHVSFSRTGIELISLGAVATPTPTPTPVATLSTPGRQKRTSKKCTPEEMLVGKC